MLFMNTFSEKKIVGIFKSILNMIHVNESPPKFNFKKSKCIACFISRFYPPQYPQLGLSGEETGWSFEKERVTEVLK